MDSTEIKQPLAPLAAAIFPEDVSCFGSENGRITIEPSGGTPPYLYSLDGVNFNGSPVQIALAPGSYDVFVKDGNGGLFDLNDVVVNEPPQIELDLGEDILVNYGSNIAIEPDIQNTDPEQLTYQWTSYNPQVPPLNPVTRVSGFTVISPTTVRLVVADSNGCKAEDLVNIFVHEYRSIQVPTGFSPNSDGVNDLLPVHGSSQMVRKIKLFQVFDRWGELLFEGLDFDINDISVGWDGTFKGQEMAAGVYVWYVEVEFVDDSIESYKGHTTLIR
ncbi:MAG: T9SS type B sorting domain-containing protein [Bacteroidota bacterium]